MVNGDETKAAIVRRIYSALNEAKARRGNYSVRQFAKKLGVASPVLVQVLNGKRNLTRKLALQLLTGIGTDPKEVARLIEGLPTRQIRKPSSQSALTTSSLNFGYSQIEASHLSVLSEWWYFATIALADTESFQSDPKWIAERLGIRIRDARNAVERLLQLGLLERCENKKIRTTGKSLTTTFDVPSTFIRRNHIQGLELAADRIQEIPVEERDYSSVTFYADRSRVTEAKRRIENFRRELVAYLEGGKRDDVYRLQVQLLPLTKRTHSKNEVKS